MYLRARALPRVLRERELVVVLGPPGSGKTSVAKRVLACSVTTLRGDKLQDACTRAVRKSAWPNELVQAKGLLIEGPTFLARRRGAARLLGELIQARVKLGLKTVVTGGADDSALLLLDAAHPRHRATVNLRFPQVGGRKRFAKQQAEDLGLAQSVGAELQIEAPWTYRKVMRALRRAVRDSETPLDGSLKAAAPAKRRPELAR
ncbi:MAG: hypothetical protein ACI9VR_001932 [Cognaticolwellia sp.]|jgi:hypothetical protein